MKVASRCNPYVMMPNSAHMNSASEKGGSSYACASNASSPAHKRRLAKALTPSNQVRSAGNPGAEGHVAKKWRIIFAPESS